MSAEYPDLEPEDTDKRAKRQPTSELWGPWHVPPPDGQENRSIPAAQFKKPGELIDPLPPLETTNAGIDPQAAYREHFSGSPLAPFPQPGVSGYPPMQGYPPYNGYASPPYAAPYPPYAPYQPYPAYPPSPPTPKRDGYLFGVGIASFVGSILVLIGGLFTTLILIVLIAVPNSRIQVDQQFMGIVTFLAFALIGVIGGSYGLYHSIRSAFLRKPSAGFAMPTFWLFVALYIAVIGVGYALHVQGQDITNEPLTVFLILMAGLMPALAVLALGNRRLRFPKGAQWPTSWRRFTFTIVSGATLGVLVAGLLEFIFSVALVRSQGIDPYQCLTNPDTSQCQNPQIYSLLLIAVAIVAPVVEETVKPLAAIILIKRVRSAAEAFVLGLSCGIGFNLIETSGYISSSYNDWLSTALERTGAGLLHGFGAAMVALGWYYLTHPGKNRVPKALGCWLYAVAQHAIWNGSWGTLLLPGAVGQFFNNSLTLGSVSISYYYFINISEAVIMLVFFLYMTGRLRKPIPTS